MYRQLPKSEAAVPPTLPLSTNVNDMIMVPPHSQLKYAEKAAEAPEPEPPARPVVEVPAEGSIRSLEIPHGAKLVLYYTKQGESITDKALAMVQQYHGVLMVIVFMIISLYRR